MALATAVSVVLMAGFAGVGGIGLASSSLPRAGAGASSAEDQYGFPQWVCLKKQRDNKGFKFKLLYAQSPGDFDGWTVVVFYGQTPGPCPPA